MTPEDTILGVALRSHQLADDISHAISVNIEAARAEGFSGEAIVIIVLSAMRSVVAHQREASVFTGGVPAELFNFVYSISAKPVTSEEVEAHGGEPMKGDAAEWEAMWRVLLN